MKKSNFSIAAGAFAGAFAAVAMIGFMGGCGKGEEVIAVINGEEITKQDLYEQMLNKPEVQVTTQNNQTATLPVAESLGFQALQDVIGRKVLLKLAKEKEVYPTDADIAAELDFKKKLNPSYIAQLNQKGLSLNTIKDAIRIDLAQERLLTRGIKVTDAEVDEYIKENPKQFIDPAKVDLSMILVKRDSMREEVDKELRSGTSFSQTAMRYSEAAGARELQGKLQEQPFVIENITDPKVKEIVLNTKEGATSDWLRTPNGWAKFYINKKSKDTPVVMDDTKKQALKRLIAQDRGRKAHDVQKSVLDRLAKSDVKVNAPAFKGLWKQKWDKFQAENSLQASTGARP